MGISLGVFLNAGAVIAGSLAGVALSGRFPERLRTIIFQALGLSIIVLGLSMALKTQDFLVLCGSMVLGGITGELLSLEKSLLGFGKKSQRLLGAQHPQFAEGFVAATMLFCLGSMTILAPLQEALEGDLALFRTKALMDVFASLVLASRYGSGVCVAVIPLFLYQNAVFFCAVAIKAYVPDAAFHELIATGGVMIVGIGVNLLGLAKLPLSNMLPALLYSVAISSLL